MSHDRTPSARAAASPGETTRRRASDILLDFLQHRHGERIALGDLVELLGDRAYGMLLLVLAIPNVVPVPGLSTAVGIPILLLGAQMVAGLRRPWLPRRLAAVSFEREAFLAVLGRAHGWIERVERHLRPRLCHLAEGTAERLLGGLIVVLAAVLALPIIFGNLPPALGIALIALGLIEKDGGFVIAGVLTSLLALVLVGAIVFGLGQAALLLLNATTGS